jgi:hypothetical protein
MKKSMNVKLAALAILLLPVVASATHVTGVELNGDCGGWSADVTLRYRSTVFEVQADYTAVLTDADGNELEVFTWDGTLTRDEGSYFVQMYDYAEEWSVVAPPGDFTITLMYHIYAPYDGGVDEETFEISQDFSCTVIPTEAQTWSDVKGLYR